ncbi:MAG: GNAT family N-acetyltransferase [Ignavibacteriales bacterium]
MESNIDIKLIDCSSEQYKQELLLRDKILRKPLGLNLFEQDLTGEANDFHIGLYSNDMLIGVLVLSRMNDIEIKMRQVAVDDTCRNKGFGTKLVMYAEDFARQLGYKKIVLNSRKTAINFYEKLGYIIVSDEFIDVTIPHYKMQKVL